MFGYMCSYFCLLTLAVSSQASALGRVCSIREAAEGHLTRHPRGVCRDKGKMNNMFSRMTDNIKHLKNAPSEYRGLGQDSHCGSYSVHEISHYKNDEEDTNNNNYKLFY